MLKNTFRFCLPYFYRADLPSVVSFSVILCMGNPRSRPKGPNAIGQALSLRPIVLGYLGSYPNVSPHMIWSKYYAQEELISNKKVKDGYLSNVIYTLCLTLWKCQVEQLLIEQLWAQLTVKC